MRGSTTEVVAVALYCARGNSQHLARRNGDVTSARGGHPLMKADDEWNVARFDDYTPSLTEDNRAPYTIVWNPEENTNE